MLVAAITLVSVTALIGLWLSHGYLINEEAAVRHARVAVVHGCFGAAGVVVFYLALHQRVAGHAGAGKFGWMCLMCLGAALALGLGIAGIGVWRGQKISPVLVASHAMLGLTGAVLLSAYWSSPLSFGR